jgi:hypothetical protein
MRTKFFRVAVAGLLLWSPGCGMAKEDETIQAAQDRPPGNEPVAGQPVATAEEICSLIKALADTKDLDVGFCPSLTGMVFPPIPSSYESYTGTGIDKGLLRSPALTKLVELGPVSMAYLLKSLDCDTPTQVAVKHSPTRYFGGIMTSGAMYFADSPLNRIVARETTGYSFGPLTFHWLNPANPREKRQTEKVKGEKRPPPAEAWSSGNPSPETMSTYSITVGDICYVIIGQITNRPYFAVQYGSSEMYYINSPVHDKNLASDVRSIWASDDHRQTLLDSLLIDFGSRDFFTGAALRLGFYFPDESEELFLHALETADTIDMMPDEKEWSETTVEFAKAMNEDMNKLDLISVVMKKELVESIALSKSRKVRAKLLDIMKGTNDIPLFVATFSAIGENDQPALVARCNEFLEALPDEDGTWSQWTFRNNGWLILQKLAERIGERAKESFVTFLPDAPPEGKGALCRVLALNPHEFVPEVLAPLLDDSTTVNARLFERPKRICDLAAEAIAKSETHLAFDTKASQEKRDRQIEKIRQHCTKIGVRRTGPVKTKDE